MNWRRRIREWIILLRRERANGIPWWGLVKAILTGPVPRTVWRRRMRICHQCPVFDPYHKACRPIDPDYRHLGCGCYTPFSALTARPYKEGCWGRTMMANIGWSYYLQASRFQAVLNFLRGR